MTAEPIATDASARAAWVQGRVDEAVRIDSEASSMDRDIARVSSAAGCPEQGPRLHGGFGTARGGAHAKARRDVGGRDFAMEAPSANSAAVGTAGLGKSEAA